MEYLLGEDVRDGASIVGCVRILGGGVDTVLGAGDGLRCMSRA